MQNKIKNILLLCLIIILVIIFSICKTNENKIENFNSKNPTISLCIQCYPPDTHELNKLMDSVRKLSVKPDQIIIGHSEMIPEDAKKLEEKYSDLSIQVVSTVKKQYAAANRNMMVKYNKCDYISFMDSDDIIIPFRFDVLKKTIIKLNPKAILHSYYYNKAPLKLETKIKKEVDGIEIYDIFEKKKSPHIGDYTVHHGHITVHKDTFKHVQQDTSEKYKRGQDAKFIRDLVKFYGRKKDTIVFIDIPLSIYLP